jgi:hypothetical protein
VHGVRAAGKPLAENQPVQRVQHQALRPAGRSGDDAHVLGLQAAFLQAFAGARTGVDLKCVHLRHAQNRSVSDALN